MLLRACVTLVVLGLCAGTADAVATNYWFKAVKLWQAERGAGDEASSALEYTMKGSVEVLGGVSKDLGCLLCDHGNDCSSTGTWASSGNQRGTVTTLRVKIDAWEDDNSDRCSFSTPLFFTDDGRVQKTCDFTLRTGAAWVTTTVRCDGGDAWLEVEMQWWPDATPAPPTSAPPTSAPPTSAPPTSAPPTSAPPTSAPPTSAPPTSAPPTSAPPTSAPPTSAPPTNAPPTSAPPTSAPPTSAPPTSAPPTSAPPTSAPPTSAPPTSAPPTSAPPTSAPPTSAPPTSAPPTSAPPTSAPPTSAPPTSAPPTSAPPTSAPPTNAPPTSAPPTSAPPTSAPPTSAPPTSAPPTSAPLTSAPPTSAPPTSAPPTNAPPTSAPPTSAPLTSAPPTSAPPTSAPPTSAPPTSAPPTSAPPTSSPPTSAPLTSAPLTSSPPTSAPPTSAPLTSAPPTAPPTLPPPTPEPISLAPPTVAPTQSPPTSAPPTVAPLTAAPPTSAPPTSAPLTVSPPTSAPPTSAPLTSAPPTNAPPTSVPPTSAPPTTAPLTGAPVTDSPPTQPPVTEAPPTAFPATSAPPTPAPSTLAPLTLSPPTPAPQTWPPVTRPPATPSPPTLSPPTLSPLTFMPARETLPPDTAAPRTDMPDTSAPTTPTPTTPAPTTTAPAAPPTDTPVLSDEETTPIDLQLTCPEPVSLADVHLANLAVTGVANASFAVVSATATITEDDFGSVEHTIDGTNLTLTVNPADDVAVGDVVVFASISSPSGHTANASCVFQIIPSDTMLTDTEEAMLSGAALASVFTASLGAASAASTLSLITSASCGSEMVLPFILHPTGLDIGDSVYLGVVVGNLGISVVVTALTYLLVVFVYRCVPSLLTVTDVLAAKGLTRFPSVALFFFLMLYQGTIYASFRLAIRPTLGYYSVFGSASVLFCLIVPGVVMYIVKSSVPSKARYLNDPKFYPHRVMWFFIGEGEWVSCREDNRWYNRYTSVVKPHREGAVYFSIFTFLLQGAVGGMNIIKTETFTACGNVKMVIGGFHVVMLLLVLIVRPFARSRDTVIFTLIYILTTCGLVFQAVGYYSEDMQHSGFGIAGGFYLACVVVILVKVLMDMVCDLFVVVKGRRGALEQELWGRGEGEKGACEMVKTETLSDMETSAFEVELLSPQPSTLVYEELSVNSASQSRLLPMSVGSTALATSTRRGMPGSSDALRPGVSSRRGGSTSGSGRNLANLSGGGGGSGEGGGDSILSASTTSARSRAPRTPRARISESVTRV